MTMSHEDGVDCRHKLLWPSGTDCDHEYQSYCPNCGVDAPDDDEIADKDGTGILYDEDGNSEYEKAMGAPYDDEDEDEVC